MNFSLWLSPLLCFLLSWLYWSTRKSLRKKYKKAIMSMGPYGDIGLGYQPQGTLQYSEQWFSQLRADCGDNETKLEFVDSLEYWVNRLPRIKDISWWATLLSKDLRHKKKKWRRECNEMIAQYEQWVEEAGIKPKILPPKGADAPGSGYVSPKMTPPPPNAVNPLMPINYVRPAELLSVAQRNELSDAFRNGRLMPMPIAYGTAQLPPMRPDLYRTEMPRSDEQMKKAWAEYYQEVDKIAVNKHRGGGTVSW